MPSYGAWLISLASAFAILLYLANRAIYHPHKYPNGLWDLQEELGASDVWMKTADGVRLHGWWIPSDDSPLVTLLLHGNAGNVSHRGSHVREITAAGSSVLVLDYRGYGKSGGWPTQRGLYQDAETGLVHLLGMGYREYQIILHGESLGSAVAVDLANSHPCAGLILEAPFSSAMDVAENILPFLGPMLIRSYNSVAKIRSNTRPKLFIHGDQDKVVPLRLGQKLFRAAQEPKHLWVVRGAQHNDILEVAGQEYRERLRFFYRTLLTD